MFGSQRLPPFQLNPQDFDTSIARNGIRMAWAQGHACPCTYNNGVQSGVGVTGSGRPECMTCFGYGIYWDTPSDPFVGLLTSMNMTRSPDEPGSHLNEKWGMVFSGAPSITIAYSLAPTVWESASNNDQIIEIDASIRYSVILIAGSNQSIPYVQNLQIEPSGAAVSWDPVALKVKSINYVVDGNQVIPVGLAKNTPYTVDFYASPTYMIQRKPGGLPHTRPFGGTLPQNEPRRFQAISLDIWTRLRRSVDSTAGEFDLIGGGESFPLSQVIQRP